MFNRKKQNIGLDIGTRALKGVCLKPDQGKVKIEKFLFHDMSSANDKYPENNPIESRLAALVEGSQMIDREVCSVLENGDVAHLEFTLPALGEKELTAAITNEVEEQLNMSQDEITYDFLSEPIENEGDKQIKIKVYWARKDLVMNRVNLIKKAKLKPQALEPAINAQIAMLLFNGYLKENNRQLVLDFGEGHISVTLLNGTSVVFTHNYPIGCGYINSCLKNALNCSYQEAEVIKTSVSAEGEGNQPPEVVEVVQKAYAEILKNIKESFEAAISDTANVDGMLVLGGGSYAPKIDQVLKTFLGIPVVIVNPLQNIEIYDAKNTELGEQIKSRAGYFSTAIGLALRGLE